MANKKSRAELIEEIGFALWGALTKARCEAAERQRKSFESGKPLKFQKYEPLPMLKTEETKQ